MTKRMKRKTTAHRPVMKTALVAKSEVDGYSLTAAEHIELRTMLRAMTADSVKRVMAALMSRCPTTADFTAVFTHALVAGLLRVGLKQKFTESRIQKWEPFFSAVESAPCVTRVMVDVAAKALPQHKEALYLSDLTTLSDAAAAVLAKHKGQIAVQRLVSLSGSPGHLALAETLAKYKGSRYLNLSGLITLCDPAAEALAKHKGTLDIGGLATLSDAAAKAFAKHNGNLDLGGLTTVSDAAAKALSQHKGDLDLSGLATLSDAAAKALSKHRGEVSLERLNTLSESPGYLALADALAKHKGPLYLDGLTTLSDAAAKALAKHKGPLLNLGGLTTLSDNAAKAFSQYKGDLDLSRLTTLSDAAAEVLATHKGELSLYGVTRLSAVAKHALERHGGNVSIYCAGQQIRVTGGDRKKTRSPVPRCLTNKNAEELLKIALSGEDTPLREQILKWSPASLSVLFAIPTNEKKSLQLLMALVMAEYLRLCTDEQERVLENLFSAYTKPLGSLLGALTKKHGRDHTGRYQEDFDPYRRSLTVAGLKCLPEEAADCLQHYPGSSIELNGVKALSDDAIALLAQFKGHLELEGLADLSEPALRALANHRDPFNDNGVSLGISKLSDASAAIIGGFRSGSVYLNNVRQLSDAQAKGLSFYKGSLYLDGLQGLSKIAAEHLATQKGYLSLTGLRRLPVDVIQALAHHKNLWR